jgi:hypothetical protein
MADLESPSSSNTLQSRKETREDKTTAAEVISSLGIAGVDSRYRCKGSKVE